MSEPQFLEKNSLDKRKHTSIIFQRIIFQNAFNRYRPMHFKKLW